MTSNCVACGSVRVMRNTEPTVHGFAAGPQGINLQGPVTSAFGGRASGALSADVCVDCGRVEFRVLDRSSLKQAYEAVPTHPLGLDG
jgi:hypothetical protein